MSYEVHDMAETIWDRLYSVFEERCGRDNLEEGRQLFADQRLQITATRSGKIEFTVVDFNGEKAKVLLERRPPDYSVTNRFVEVLITDEESYQAYVQNKTPDSIYNLLKEAGFINQIESRPLMVTCSCRTGQEICPHIIAAISQLVEEIPGRFSVFLAYSGFDPMYIQNLIRYETRQRRTIIVDYDEFWRAREGYDIKRLEGVECFPRGIWLSGAPAIIAELLPDIEATLVHVKEDARLLFEKTILQKGQKGTDNPRKGRGRQASRVHPDAPDEKVNTQN